MSIKNIVKYEFNSQVLNSDAFCIVDFWAPWCKPCVAIGQSLSDINVIYKGSLNIYKINVDDEQELAASIGIMSVPTILIFFRGKIVSRIVGLHSTEELIGNIEQSRKAVNL